MEFKTAFLYSSIFVSVLYLIVGIVGLITGIIFRANAADLAAGVVVIAYGIWAIFWGWVEKWVGWIAESDRDEGGVMGGLVAWSMLPVILPALLLALVVWVLGSFVVWDLGSLVGWILKPYKQQKRLREERIMRLKAAKKHLDKLLQKYSQEQTEFEPEIAAIREKLKVPSNAAEVEQEVRDLGRRLSGYRSANPSLPKFPSRGAETKGCQLWEWSILNGD
jgi:hypothetical protein